MNFLRNYLLALQFFTRIPVTGRLAAWVGFSPQMLRASAAHFPGVGWLVGFLVTVLQLALFMGLPVGGYSPLVLATLGTAFGILVTGAFHEDGLADTADGLGGVGMEDDALVAAEPADVSDRLDGADLVVRGHDRHEHGRRADRRGDSIGIDPAFQVTTPLHCDLELVKATSDDFFTRTDPIRHLRSARNPLRNVRRGRPLLGHYRGGPFIDLAFIDGMHLFEYALRDFINIEKHADWSSVIVFDDMLPRSIDEAARDRHTTAWTGDVYKVIEILGRYRPDLVTVLVDTQPTGQLVVFGADPKSTVLKDKYDEITLTVGHIPPEQRISLLARLRQAKGVRSVESRH